MVVVVVDGFVAAVAPNLIFDHIAPLAFVAIDGSWGFHPFLFQLHVCPVLFLLCSSLCVFWEGRGRGGEAGAWMCIFSVAIYLCVKRMACWISILAFLKAELLFFVVISCRNPSAMAPKKRVRDEAASRPDPYPKPKAIRTLEDHGILNGYSAKDFWSHKTWHRSEHYKNQGLPNEIAEKNRITYITQQHGGPATLL